MPEISIAVNSAASKSYLGIIQDLGQLPQDGNIVKVIGLHRSRNGVREFSGLCVLFRCLELDISRSLTMVASLKLIRTLAVMEHCGSRSSPEF